MRRWKALNILVVTLFFRPAFADDPKTLDPASQAALVQTQQLLNDQSARQQSIQKSGGNAQKVDDFTQKMTGSAATSNEIYALAADVFANVVKNCQGDPAKMAAALKEFEKNPEAFSATWTPEQKKKLHDLSLRIPAANSKP